MNTVTDQVREFGEEELLRGLVAGRPMTFDPGFNEAVRGGLFEQRGRDGTGEDLVRWGCNPAFSSIKLPITHTLELTRLTQMN